MSSAAMPHRGLVVCVALVVMGVLPCSASVDDKPMVDTDADIQHSCEAVSFCYYSSACRDDEWEKEHKDNSPYGWSFRQCFFACLRTRIPTSEEDDDGEAEFVEYAEDLYDWCDEKRGKGASDSKVKKCVLKKIKKGACDGLFEDEGYDDDDSYYYYEKQPEYRKANGGPAAAEDVQVPSYGSRDLNRPLAQAGGRKAEAPVFRKVLNKSPVVVQNQEKQPARITMDRKGRRGSFFSDRLATQVHKLIKVENARHGERPLRSNN